MKVLSALLALCGLAGLSGISSAEGGSIVVVLFVSGLFFFGAYKLWKKEPKPKQKVVAVAKRERVPINPYMDMSIFEKEELLQPIDYDEIYLRDGEQVYYAIPARTFHLKKGERTVKSLGDYVVTNQRILFLGEADSFDVPLEKVTSLRMGDFDSFYIMYGKTTYNVMVGDFLDGRPDLEAEYSYLATHEMIKRFS